MGDRWTVETGTKVGCAGDGCGCVMCIIQNRIDAETSSVVESVVWRRAVILKRA